MTHAQVYAQYNPVKVNLVTVVNKSVLLGVVASVALLLTYHCGGSALGVFVVQLCVFHYLEFVTTCLFNNGEVDDDSFILTDHDLHLVYGASVVEHLLATRVSHWDWSWPRTGLVVAVVGQAIRTGAMYTARESFNHYIQRQHNEKKHTLVTHGIYSVLRHPSYFGFWWWFVGLQLSLGNVVVLIGGGWKLWWFFHDRIQFEESFLKVFFKEYDAYKASTKTWIPFIE